MTGLKLEELNWGICNDIADTNQAQITGDPRRTSPASAVQRATALAFSPDTVGARTDYNGFVVASQQITYATYRNRASMFQSYAAPATQTSGTPTEYDNIAYKVYIPELMPQPAPPSNVTPEDAAIIIATYPDVFPELGFNEQIPNGSLVTVRYENPQYLTNPRIINIIERAVGVVIGAGTERTLQAQHFRGVPEPPPQQHRFEQVSGPEDDDSRDPSTNEPNPPVLGPSSDDGSFTWSNRARQLTFIWKAPPGSPYENWNGRVVRNGEVPNDMITQVGYAKLLKPAAVAYKKMSAAFKAKFGFPLNGSGYRSYDSQVFARLKRVSGDLHRCDEPLTVEQHGEGEIGSASQKRSRAATRANRKIARERREAKGMIYGDGIGAYEYAKWERTSSRKSERTGKYRVTTGYRCGPIPIEIAAVPGNSKHGWAAAVDLRGRKMSADAHICGDGYEEGTKKGTEQCIGDENPPAGLRGIFTRQSKYFNWIRDNGKNYGWVFSVKGEQWHINWFHLNNYISPATVPMLTISSRTPAAFRA